MGILEVGEEMSHVHICGDLIPSQKTKKCKGFEGRMCQVYLRNRKEVRSVGR